MLLTTLAAAALLAPATPPTPGPLDDHGKLAWFEGSFEELMAKAKEEDKIVFLDFWTDWCGWCKRLDKETFSADAVVAEMGDVLCYSIDAESREGAPIALKYGVASYPTLLFLEPSGDVRDLINGYLPPEPFQAEVQRIKRNEGTISGLRKRVAEQPDDLELRYEYAKKLKAVHDLKGYEEQAAFIRERDPEGKTFVARKLRFDELYGDIRRALEKGTERKLEPMMAFLREVDDSELLFEGWSLIAMANDFDGTSAEQAGMTDVAKDLKAKGRAAYAEAWPHCPEDELSTFGNQVAWVFWLARDELDEAEKAWALEVSKSAVKADDANHHLLDTLACCYFMNGDHEQALEVIERCKELDPENELWAKRVEEFTPEG
jgi:thiol-disulfide isomerase/thioredoxin